jgi:hypothetical protein
MSSMLREAMMPDAGGADQVGLRSQRGQFDGVFSKGIAAMAANGIGMVFRNRSAVITRSGYTGLRGAFFFPKV